MRNARLLYILGGPDASISLRSLKLEDTAATTSGTVTFTCASSQRILMTTRRTQCEWFSQGCCIWYRTGNKMFTVANSLSRSLFVEVTNLALAQSSCQDQPVDELARRSRRGMVLCAVHDSTCLGRGNNVSGEIVNIIPGNTL